MPCSEPSPRAPVAIHASRGSDRYCSKSQLAVVVSPIGFG